MKGDIWRRSFRYLRRVVNRFFSFSTKVTRQNNWEFLDPPIENIFYFSGRVKDIYQLEMWIQPFLDCGLHFYVCAREAPVFIYLQSRGIKAILILKFQDLGVLCDRGSKNIFYVNNSAKNTHMIRYPQMMHIQLLHGDSDKPPSYNPVSQMYDFLFVAGEGAIERYFSNGVFIPLEKFVICSRPQLKPLDLPNEAHQRLADAPQIVLFCTTWGGHQESSNYSSLNIIYEAILDALRDGLSVIFRPHPLSCKDNDDQDFIKKIVDMLENYKYQSNQFGRYSNPLKGEDIFDNYYFVLKYADFLVGDLASSVHDWVYLNKPFIITKSDFILHEQYYNSSLYKCGQFSIWERTMSLDTLLKFESNTFDQQLASERRAKLLGVREGEKASDIFRKALLSAIKPDSKKIYIEGLFSKHNRSR